MGDDSFGKGTVQEWQPLPDDTGGFRLTVAKWLTPDKRWIHDTGLVPDVRADAGPAAEIGAEDADPVLKALEVLGETAVGPTGARRLTPRTPLLHRAHSSRKVSRERKEVMCSVRTRAHRHLAGDDRLVGSLPRVVKPQSNAGPFLGRRSCVRP